jgi:hypothetical protein
MREQLLRLGYELSRHVPVPRRSDAYDAAALSELQSPQAAIEALLLPLRQLRAGGSLQGSRLTGNG